MYQGWSLNWPNTRCFFYLTNKCHEGDINCYCLDQKSPLPPPKKKTKKTTHKTKNKKKLNFFLKVRFSFFWRDFSKSFSIPKDDFSVARKQSLRHSFRWGYFFRRQCSVLLWVDNFLRRMEGDNVLRYSFRWN